MFDAKTNNVKGPTRLPYPTALVYIASSTRKFFLFLPHACNFLDLSYELLRLFIFSRLGLCLMMAHTLAHLSSPI